MRKNTRVFTMAIVLATLMGVTLGGCTTGGLEKPYAFKHSIFGDDLVPLTPDQVTSEGR